MKKTIVLSLVVLLSTTSSISQDLVLLNKTASDKNSKIIYIGIENVFEIQGQSLKGIVPKQGVIIKGNKLKIQPTTVGKLPIIFITGEEQKQIDFIVKRVPDITLVLEGQTKEEIQKGIQGQITFKSTNDEDGFFADHKVVSYTATFGGKTYEISGNKFPSDLISAIGNTKNSDVLTISDVKGSDGKGNKSVNLHGPFEFKVQ